MIDYNALKRMAKERRTPITELIALAPNNDPFYVGQPAQIKKAGWFRNAWDKFGKRNFHLRRMHYRIISQQEPVLMPSGLPYGMNWRTDFSRFPGFLLRQCRLWKDRMCCLTQSGIIFSSWNITRTFRAGEG